MSELFNPLEQQLLDFTISKRKKLIDLLTIKDELELVPDKTGDKILLNSLLDGLDKAIHTKAKLKIEDKVGKQQEEISSMIGDLLNRINPNSYTQALSTNNNVREVPAGVKLTDVVPGETEIGGEPITYDEFMKE